MLVNISFDSLGWNALHCGIDAKVRRKNDKQKNLSSYPKAGDLRTKSLGLEDETVSCFSCLPKGNFPAYAQIKGSGSDT